MKFRQFYNLPTLIILGVFIIFYGIAYNRVHSNLNRLRNTERETVANNARSKIKAEQERLRSLVTKLGNNSNLATEFISALRTRKEMGLIQTLEQFRIQERLDLIDIVDDLSGKSVLKKDLTQDKDLLSTYQKFKTGYQIIEIDNERYLVAYSPLKYHSQTEGILLIGTSLNLTLAKKVSEETNTVSRFVPKSDVLDGSNVIIEIEISKDSQVQQALQIESNHSDGIKQSTLIAIFAIGMMALVLLTFSLRLYVKRVRSQSRKEMYAEIAEGVSHDLKSPLIALENALSDDNAQQIPDHIKKKIRASFGRVKDISNVLAANRRTINQDSNPLDDGIGTFMVARLSSEILSEKRIQYKALTKIDITDEFNEGSYGIFCNLSAVDFKRVLSNLIDNAVEALPESGDVVLRIEKREGFCVLRLIDTGKGFPEGKIGALLKKGATYGKAKGSGLGLWQSKQKIEAMGGSILIDSKPGYGTTVNLTLPVAVPPKWFISELNINDNTKIIVLDDDEEVFRSWKNRLEGFSFLELIHFNSPEQFILNWKHEKRRTQNLIFLCDYDFKNTRLTGFDVIRKCKLFNNAILVTNHFESVRQYCGKAKLKLLPKELLHLIPIRVEPDIHPKKWGSL